MLGCAPSEQVDRVSLGMGETEVLAEAASGWDNAHPTPRAPNTLSLSNSLPLGKAAEAPLGAAETQGPPSPLRNSSSWAGELSLPQL